MAITSPVRMTQNTISILKGPASPENVLDYVSQFVSTTVANLTKRGMCVSLNSAGLYVLGCPLAAMPMFLYNVGDDLDVNNYGGDPSAERDAWVPTQPSGAARAYVGGGGHELCTTAYVTTSSYPPNTPLASTTGTGATAGLLRPAVVGTDSIVGVVSQGVVDNGFGANPAGNPMSPIPALAFWSFPTIKWA